MKYSIIIPTMWFHIAQLYEMLPVYASINSVGEILLIDNNGVKRPELNFDKVRIIGNGKNIYVNPSWKLGVQESKFDNIVLVNDDITVQGDIYELFRLISFLLSKDTVIGVDEKCFTNIETEIGFKKITVKNKISYGFGVFMFMQKSTFLNTLIPNDILVWYGDSILYLKNKAWTFEGVNILTEMGGTSRKLNLSGFALREKQAFERYLKLGK